MPTARRDREIVSSVGSDDRSDAELVAAIAEGERDALRSLYERHQPWLLARLRRRCPDPDLVVEAVQDTFLAVWRSASRWNGSGEVAAWIWGIAIRQLIGKLRRKRLPTVAWPEREAARVGLDFTTAEDRVLLGVEHGDLAGALDGLSPELRAVVQATVLDGLTTREASRLLGIPPGTVKTRMLRARTQLRGALA